MTFTNHRVIQSPDIRSSSCHGDPISPSETTPARASPSAVLSPAGVGPGLPLAQAIEDDVSLLWLIDQSQTEADQATLAASRALFGGGEIFAGNSLELSFSDPAFDSRTPDIIVAPNVGAVYTGGTSKVSEHGRFANDDRKVLLIVSNAGYTPSVYTRVVETRQVAPTVLEAPGFDPGSLQAVQKEGPEVLPGLPFTGEKK
jgi:hypothetical protein